MMAAEEAARAALIETCLAMNASGINQGTSGNVSVRWGEGLLITPSALAYAAMTPADIVYLAPDGTPQGARPPSSEWRFHRDILMARPDVEAVVHCHSTFATALALWIVPWLRSEPDDPIAQLSFLPHLREMIAGALRLSDVTYFVGFVFLFLFATHQRVESHRWS